MLGKFNENTKNIYTVLFIHSNYNYTNWYQTLNIVKPKLLVLLNTNLRRFVFN